MSGHYILEGEEAVPVDFMTWAKWLESHHNERVVKQEEANGVKVSTVFLGLDHSFGQGQPQIFETMIFGGPHDQEQWRCSTWEEAEKQHTEAVAHSRQVSCE